MAAKDAQIKIKNITFFSLHRPSFSGTFINAKTHVTYKDIISLLNKRYLQLIFPQLKEKRRCIKKKKSCTKDCLPSFINVNINLNAVKN